MVMKRIAILEEEKNAADKRIEEEYRRRMDNEDRYYLEKREALLGAITEIQESAYGDLGGDVVGGGVVDASAATVAKFGVGESGDGGGGGVDVDVVVEGAGEGGAAVATARVEELEGSGAAKFTA